MWGISALGLTIALLIYTITLKADVPQWVGTLGVFLFFMFYGFGEGPITWFLSGELFPDSVRYNILESSTGADFHVCQRRNKKSCW